VQPPSRALAEREQIELRMEDAISNHCDNVIVVSGPRAAVHAFYIQAREIPDKEGLSLDSIMSMTQLTPHVESTLDSIADDGRSWEIGAYPSNPARKWNPNVYLRDYSEHYYRVAEYMDDEIPEPDDDPRAFARIIYSFGTANTPPLDALAYASLCNPQLVFVITFAEILGNFSGLLVLKNGQQLHAIDFDGWEIGHCLMSQ
jgi:hypothetical protein